MKLAESNYNAKQVSGFFFTVVCIWIFVLVGRPQDIVSGLAVLRPAMLLSLVVLWGVLTTRNLDLSGVCVTGSQGRLYMLLVGLMLLSVPFSFYARSSFFFMFEKYLPSVLFFFVFYGVSRDVRKLTDLLFVCSLAVGFYALFALSSGVFVQGRITFGQAHDPNDIAFVVISFIIFNLLFINRTKGGWGQALAMVNLCAGLLLLLKTGSRGGFVALCCMLGMFVLSGRLVAIRPAHKFIILGLAVVLGVAQSVDFSRYESILDYQNDYNVTSETGRFAIWETGMKIMFQHPLTGVGVNCFPEAVGRYREQQGASSISWQTAHNSWVQIGGEIGVFGMLLFGLLNLNAYVIFRKAAKQSSQPSLSQLGEVARIGFVGHAVCAFFLSQAYSIFWVFFIALSAVVQRLMVKGDKSVRGARGDSLRRFYAPSA